MGNGSCSIKPWSYEREKQIAKAEVPNFTLAQIEIGYIWRHASWGRTPKLLHGELYLRFLSGKVWFFLFFEWNLNKHLMCGSISPIPIPKIFLTNRCRVLDGFVFSRPYVEKFGDFKSPSLSCCFFHVTDVTVANLAIKDISISDVGFFSFCSGSTQIRGSYFVPCWGSLIILMP